MGVWNKAPQVDPAVIARLQAILDANPVIRQYREGGYGTDRDLWRRGQGGRVSDPNQLSKYAADLLGGQLPEGYNVDQQGRIVYGNETPLLQQLTLASLPITGPLAVQGLRELGAGAGAAGGANLSGFGGATTGTGAAAALGLPGAAGAAGGAGLGSFAAKTGGGIWDWVKNNPDKVIQGIGAAAGAVAGGGQNTMDDPNVRALMEMAVKRQQRVDPLHDMTTRLASAMMPRMVQPPREG